MSTTILIPVTAWIVALVGVLRVPSNLHRAHAFVSNHRSPRTRTMTENLGSDRGMAQSILWYTNSPGTISEKTASELRKELESYGVSTSSMFERREFEDALTKAKVMENEKEKEEVHGTGNAQKVTTSSNTRNETDQKESKNEDSSNTTQEKWSTKWENVVSVAKEALGKYAAGPTGDSSSTKPYQSDNQNSDFASLSSSTSMPSPSPSPSPSPTKSRTRRERYEKALNKGRSMRVSRLKQELKERGISSNSFFEKSELAKAYANSIVDGIKTKDSKGHNTSRHSEQNSFDPSYRKMIMHAFDPSTLMVGDIVIDITENVEWA